MNIELLYFGRPAERLHTTHESIAVPDDLAKLGDLLAWLRQRGEDWQSELAEKRIRCAINQEFCGLEARLHDCDEVAIFSPISGG